MTEFRDHPLALMVRKLDSRNPLGPDERAAILALPFIERNLAVGQYVVWDGDRSQHSCLLKNGFAFRHKLAGDGGRQILSIHMRGDLVDLHNCLLGVADHNIQMLTAGTLALIPMDAMREIALRFPAVGMAMWHETMVEGSISREWILNIGRRDARTRIAHLLCEFAMRMNLAEIGSHSRFELPITQEQLADAVSLTAIHVNRTLKKLEGDGFISRSKRLILINDWHKLVQVADFDPRYLHVPAIRETN